MRSQSKSDKLNALRHFKIVVLGNPVACCMSTIRILAFLKPLPRFVQHFSS